jgi:hypothetical protein
MELALVQAVRVVQVSSVNVVSFNIGRKAKVRTARVATFSFRTREAEVSQVKPFSHRRAREPLGHAIDSHVSGHTLITCSLKRSSPFVPL